MQSLNNEAPFDSIWPGEEDIERLWAVQGGTDFDGMGWLTPRMMRISDHNAKKWSKESEMPNCPVVKGCQCYSDEREPCVCGLTEKALRWWCREGTTLRMTPEQREWCYQEIDRIEAHDRQDYVTATDSELATGVLSAWMDYCRDKGLM